MNYEDIIKEKLDTKNREKISYIHPVIPNKKIAEYISAYANEDGGFLLFGVNDDGLDLYIKKSAFNISNKEKEIRELLSMKVGISFGFFYQDDNKLEYIYINPSSELIRVNDIAYVFDKSHKPIPLKPKSIFLSYCQKDSSFADGIEEGLSKIARKIKITRDIRDVPYKESFSKFMHTISEHDFVISIVSDNYLKSRNCMYEVVEVMRNNRYIDRLLYVIIKREDCEKKNNIIDEDLVADIFNMNGQNKYNQYWEEEEMKLQKIIKDSNPLQTKNYVDELHVIRRIQLDIQEFMSELKDRKGISYSEMLSTGFKDIISIIND